MKKQKKQCSLRLKMMGINVSITLASFLLCGFLFVMAVQILVGRYVNHDLDFFLTETSSNLQYRLEYMEDVIYSMRDSDKIMNYLSQPFAESESEEIINTFSREADISHLKNQGDGNGPMVEKVYLFREDGNFLSAFYYAMLYSEMDESDHIMKEVWSEFQKENSGNKGFYNSCWLDKNKAFLTYPILDEGLEKKGVIVFELNLNAVEKIMDEMRIYGNSFWLLYDQDSRIDGDNDKGIQLSLDEIKRESQQTPKIQKINGIDYRIYSNDLCLNLSVTSGVPQNQTMVVLYDSMNIYMIGIVTILFVGLISFAIFTYKVTKPIEEVTEKLKQVQEGNFETKLPDYNNKEFHEISMVFNEMTEYISHLIKQVYEKQIAVKELELKFLQSQMNPHFMFNVLNALALQAKIDKNEELCQLISAFSRLIQAKIYRSETEKVQISQELEYVNYYLAIQKFRYGERLTYSVNISDDSILELYLPKLCIQMLVENAIVHGLEPKMGNGTVIVNINKVEGMVVIEVTDDGGGFDTDGLIQLPLKRTDMDASHNHVGLSNVHNIIQLMYGKEFGITIYSKKNQGTQVLITIPLDVGESAENCKI